MLTAVDMQICHYDESIRDKYRTSVAEAVRAGLGPITPNGRRYSNPVELYVQYDTSGEAHTLSFTRLVR